MNADLALVLFLLAAAVAMFLINKPRMDAVALIMLTVLPFTGVISMGEALSGFSDPNIVLIAALFVMGEGLCGPAWPNGSATGSPPWPKAAKPCCSPC